MSYILRRAPAPDAVETTLFVATQSLLVQAPVVSLVEGCHNPSGGMLFSSSLGQVCMQGEGCAHLEVCSRGQRKQTAKYWLTWPANAFVQSHLKQQPPLMPSIKKSRSPASFSQISSLLFPPLSPGTTLHMSSAKVHQLTACL